MATRESYYKTKRKRYSEGLATPGWGSLKPPHKEQDQKHDKDKSQDANATNAVVIASSVPPGTTPVVADATEADDDEQKNYQ